MPFAENLAVFFDPTGGFATVATWGGQPANVIYDAPAEDVLSGQVVGTDFSVTLPANVWPAIARDAVIIITGQGTFTVREVRPIADGAMKRLVLGT
jgi:hypothetical protein